MRIPPVYCAAFSALFVISGGSNALAWNCDTDCNKVACTKVFGQQICEPATLSSCEIAKHADCITRTHSIDDIARTILVPTIVAGPLGTTLGLIALDQTSQGAEKARREIANIPIPTETPPASGHVHNLTSDCLAVMKSDKNVVFAMFKMAPSDWGNLKVTDVVKAQSNNAGGKCGLQEDLVDSVSDVSFVLTSVLNTVGDFPWVLNGKSLQ